LLLRDFHSTLGVLAFWRNYANLVTTKSIEFSVNTPVANRFLTALSRARYLWLGVCIAALSGSTDASALSPYLRHFPALMDTLLGGYYGAAEQICEQIATEYPDHPAAPYARATTLYSKFFDLEDSTGQGEFFVLVDSCLSRCDRQLRLTRTDEDRAVIHFLRGSALSIKGLTYRQHGSVLTTVRLLMSSRSAFSRAIRLDPDFYDAYLGRGAYRYGVAREAPAIGWLPFMPSRKSGLRDMALAVDSSRFSSFPALTALVWFEIEDGHLARADSICRAGLARYPNSRSFLWPALALHKKRGQWDEAFAVASNLLAQYLVVPDDNGYDVTGLYATLSECADSLGKPDQALEFARAALAAARSPHAEERREKTLKQIRKRLDQHTEPLEGR